MLKIKTGKLTNSGRPVSSAILADALAKNFEGTCRFSKLVVI
jgi:hypothetical protein